MSGERYLLDTNAIVALLRGNQALLQRLGAAEWVGLSIISQIEFLAFSGLSEHDREAFRRFLDRVVVVGLGSDQPALLQLIVKTRRDHRLKLPDAIIAATSMWCGATLVTADLAYKRITKLKLLGLK